VGANRCPDDGAAVETVWTLPKNTRLGAYRIDRMLGEGGMGFVYEATHEILNRRSAIKMLRPELASQAHIVVRFLNEAKAINLIDHQNIVNVYDYGDNQGGSVYFVMEFLEGETLDDLMRKRQPMPVALLLHVFGQIGKALAAAHAKQIVHRDLKPVNVYVIAREHNPYFVKLLDFGIAQLRGAGAVQGLTLAGSVMGTPQYMSPEQIVGSTVDARSDVWAVGVMLYRAATGQAPFKGEEFAELADKILHQVPRPAGEIAAVPAALSALIASCLQRRPEDRCPSVAELLAGLERAKWECKLDDEAILAAVTADAGATRAMEVPPQFDPTRESLAGSLPRYQGAPGVLALAPSAGPPPRSKLAWYATLATAVGVLGAAGFIVRGRGEKVKPAVAIAPRSSGNPAAPRSIKDAVDAGSIAGGRALANQDLQGAIASGDLQRQGFAVDALARARVPAGAPLLYAALEAAPEVRVKAARALGDLVLPDAAPKLRRRLAESGDKVKVELAAAGYRLGDKDARAILMRAIQDPGMRLVAALAMAESADDGGRAVLADVVGTMPPGREQWRRAAGGLVKLGDANARKLLESELAQPDPARSVGAAELLARAGDAGARELLARVVADKDFARRGDAALALARLGDRRALDWVGDGLASTDPEDRMLALSVFGTLATGATGNTRAIATIATDDPDPRVRMTAEAIVLGL